MSGESRPAPHQELLLRAILLEETAAWAAWAAWTKDSSDLPLDEASSRLLPLLHLRLSERDFLAESPGSGAHSAIRLRALAAFEQTRYRNALLFEEASAAIRALAEAGVATCLLKGSALAVTVYQEPALRPMSDVDLLVKPEDLRRTVAALRRVGWKTPSRLGPEELAEAHAAAFTNDARGSIDLHWRSLDIAPVAGGDDALWMNSRAAILGGEAARVPSPTDLLLHACIGGQRWGRDMACRWVADALTILTAAHSELDWGRFETEAIRQGISAPAADALAYLRTVFGAPVPADTPERLAATRVRPAQGLAARALRRAPELRGPMLAAAVHFEAYRRLVDGGILPSGPWGFLRAVARTWGLASAWLVPFHVAWRGARRLVQIGRSWWRGLRPSSGHT